MAAAPRRARHATRALALGVLLWLPGAAPGQAGEEQDPPGLQPVDSVPPPPPLRSGEPLESQVTIGERRGTVQEYRVAGRLVAIKVVPRDAPAYYLVDTDGDGHLETRRHELEADILVNSWLLFTWP